MSLRVFILAGEPSGDKLGGALMEGLHQISPGVEFQGIGGPLMQGQGLSSRFPMEELSVMGIAEVLPKYRHLKRRIRETADAVLNMKPDVLITIDSPDFSLRVAKLVKKASAIRTVHYVAPSVWAWRPKRAEKMAASIDHVLALLPFEPPYMRAAGMDCDFVGHPVVAEPAATAADIAAMRLQLGLGDGAYMIALPGSRRSEVSRLAPVFGPALAEFQARRPDLRIVLPAAAPVADLVQQEVRNWAVDPVIFDPEALSPDTAGNVKRALFAGADLALAASGTVSLELARARTPMVVAYSFQWLTWQIMRRMALIDTVTLVNLVSDSRVVPECLGPECTPGNIADALGRVILNPGPQEEAMALTMARLGEGGDAPGLRAARAILDRLG